MLIIWAAMTNLLYILADKVIANMIFIMLGYMIIYPVCTLVICFLFARGHGFKWYLFTAMLVITVCEYIFISGFRSITPNIIVMTIICIIFGGGIGNCFADKFAIEQQTQKAKQKKNNEDKPYKKILDD